MKTRAPMMSANMMIAKTMKMNMATSIGHPMRSTQAATITSITAAISPRIARMYFDSVISPELDQCTVSTALLWQEWCECVGELGKGK